ncbi:hypothetical protein ILUMI_22753 [Ignelater luminosus]|uniref:ABC transporter domain-containing protein n=1 Tax=Ignelater luminosus TaxID=2038154 RepID=A0A8K0CA18_IGNLU|nr:hypothetical protein ILUMI_22753 [Ignelater luminosus]
MVQSSDDNKSTSLQVRPQSSMISHEMNHSVYVKNAYKHYGTKKNPVNVLNGLSMTVPRGTIYGLLGASGCGKTTLLNCVVGRKQLDSGEVWVLGGVPGTKGCDVLGNKLGYMPQEMALYVEFSIRETLLFYGWVAGMKSEKTKERIDFLVDLLMLPKPSRHVQDLSTGQQRRVSLAAALIHEPELLILDEPTVGVDPVLRQIIWDHFKEISNNGRTSIIITTHYIDETRQAKLIGLMRKGVLLAEQAPESLISQFNALTLEEVFLKLSIAQNTQQGKLIFDNLQSSVSMASTSRIKMICKAHHVRALVWKNGLWLISHIPILLFTLTMPVIQMVLFLVCIGHNPRDLPIAVVNYESNNDPNCNTTLFCNSSRLSCSYFSYIKAHGLNLIYYNSEEEATESVLKGDNYASVVVPENYSDSLKRRILRWKWSRQWDVKYSTVNVVPDLSNKAIVGFVFFHLSDSFRNFLEDFLKSCNWKSRFFMPINVSKVY